MSERTEMFVVVGAIVGIGAAFAGVFLDTHGAGVLAVHALHGVLLAVPASLLAALLLRPRDPADLQWSAFASFAGFIAGEALLVAAIGGWG